MSGHQRPWSTRDRGECEGVNDEYLLRSKASDELDRLARRKVSLMSVTSYHMWNQ
jgi:hypothetical protein